MSQNSSFGASPIHFVHSWEKFVELQVPTEKIVLFFFLEKGVGDDLNRNFHNLHDVG